MLAFSLCLTGQTDIFPQLWVSTTGILERGSSTVEIWAHVLGLCGLEVSFTFPVSSSVELAGSFTGSRLATAVRRQTEIGHHEIMTSEAASSVSPPSHLSSTLPPPHPHLPPPLHSFLVLAVELRVNCDTGPALYHSARPPSDSSHHQRPLQA